MALIPYFWNALLKNKQPLFPGVSENEPNSFVSLFICKLI